MKILVTGAAGYLGSILNQRFLEKGYSVNGLDVLLFGGESLLSYINSGRFLFFKGDVRDEKLVKKALVGVDAVCHLAALVGEPACKVNPKLTEEINHKAAVSVCRIAKKEGVKRFIFASTCSNYGLSDTGKLATEDDPLNPLSLYAKTKIAAEEEILQLNGTLFGTTLLRFATIFGLSPRMRFNLIINEMVREAYLKNKIEVYNEEAWRPFTHVEDAAEALITSLQASREKISGQIFNVASENFQKKQIVELIKKHIPGVEVINKGGGFDSRDYRVSCEKIKNILGFNPKKSVTFGIEEMLQALKDGIFGNPYDKRFDLWIDEEKLLQYETN